MTFEAGLERDGWVEPLCTGFDVAEAAINRRQLGAETEAGSGQSPTSVVMNSGTSEEFEFVPAIEYNWRSYVGVIVETRVIPASHGTNETITPVMASNFVR